MEEFPAKKSNGFSVLFVLLALLALAVYLVVLGAGDAANVWVYVGSMMIVLLCIVFSGLTIVPPNHGNVVTFFGRYIGSIRTSGFWFVKPLSGRERVSLQVRNFKTRTLKVNDAEGNPVEVAAVIVFRVVDTEKAILEVEKYEEFVEIQSKTALRLVLGEVNA
ncbi:MAG: SPFH domain-containing protein [Dethiobacteraceae bacterium]